MEGFFGVCFFARRFFLNRCSFLNDHRTDIHGFHNPFSLSEVKNILGDSHYPLKGGRNDFSSCLWPHGRHPSQFVSCLRREYSTRDRLPFSLSLCHFVSITSTSTNSLYFIFFTFNPFPAFKETSFFSLPPPFGLQRKEPEATDQWDSNFSNSEDTEKHMHCQIS